MIPYTSKEMHGCAQSCCTAAVDALRGGKPRLLHTHDGRTAGCGRRSLHPTTTAAASAGSMSPARYCRRSRREVSSPPPAWGPSRAPHHTPPTTPPPHRVTQCCVVPMAAARAPHLLRRWGREGVRRGAARRDVRGGRDVPWWRWDRTATA